MSDQRSEDLATDDVPPGEEPPTEQEELEYLQKTGWPS